MKKTKANTFVPSKQDLINQIKWDLEAIEKIYKLGKELIEEGEDKKKWELEKEAEIKKLKADLKALLNKK